MLALAGGVHNTKRHLIFIALILPTIIVSANATKQCPNKPEFERTSLTTAFVDRKTMTMYSSSEAGPSASTSTSGTAKRIRRADSSTIQDKFLVGYQAWFHCPGDGEPIYEGHHGWLHWFNAPPEHGGHINTDLWPDFSEYDADELYPAPGMRYANGEQVYLYSNRNAKTIQRHFHWMATHGVDGAMLQRFLNIAAPGNEGSRKLRDDIGDLVRDAAEKEGRTYAMMYDVSGIPNDMVHDLLIEDWKHLLRNKNVLNSPNYLHEGGKPVIVLWGFGLGDRGHTPATVRAVAQSMRAATPGGDAYIMAGVAAGWRTSTADADPDPELAKVWLQEYDAISPWTIGRYNSEESADAFARERMRGDVDAINAHNERVRESGQGRKVDYVPVIQPGSSGHNTSHGQWNFNDAKRNGGRFLWRQIYNARKLGVRTMYGAMWDEYDEGTAYMPVVAHKRQLPIMGQTRFMALDEDGYHDLTPDWYMRIAGFAAEILKGERSVYETFPVKDLYDYWASRPKYEYYDPAAEEAARNEWARERDKKLPGLPAAQGGFANDKDGEEDVPPPPYSLEDDMTPAPAPVVASPPPSSSSSSFPPPVITSPRPAVQQVQDSAVAALSEDFARQAPFGSSSSSSIATSSSSSSSRPPPPPRHPSTRPLAYTPSAALRPPPRHPSVSPSPSPSSTSPSGLPPPVPQKSRPGNFVAGAPSSPPPPLAPRPAQGQGLGSQSSLPYAPYGGGPVSAMIPQPQDDREEYLHQHHHSHSHSQHHHHHLHGSSPSGGGSFAPPLGPPPGMRPQSATGYGPSSQSTCPPMPEPMSPTSPSSLAPHGHGGFAPVYGPSSSSPPIPRPNPSPSPGPGAAPMMGGGQGGRYNPPLGPPPSGMSSYGPPPGPPPMQGYSPYGGSPSSVPYTPYTPYAPYSPPAPPAGGAGGGPMAFPQAQPYYTGQQQPQPPPPPQPQFGLPPGQQYHYQQQQQQQSGGQSRLTPQSVVNRVWGMLNSI